MGKKSDLEDDTRWLENGPIDHTVLKNLHVDPERVPLAPLDSLVKIPEVLTFQS